MARLNWAKDHATLLTALELARRARALKPNKPAHRELYDWISDSPESAKLVSRDKPKSERVSERAREVADFCGTAWVEYRSDGWRYSSARAREPRREGARVRRHGADGAEP